MEDALAEGFFLYLAQAFFLTINDPQLLVGPSSHCSSVVFHWDFSIIIKANSRHIDCSHTHIIYTAYNVLFDLVVKER